MEGAAESGGSNQAGAPQRIVLLGGGGHASDVLGVIEFTNRLRPTWTVVGVADDSAELRLDRFEGRGVRFLGSIDDALRTFSDVRFIATVGFPEGRRSVAERAERAGWRAATLVDPRAIVETRARIGEGAVVTEGAHVSPMCRIGRHAYLGPKVMVGHDVEIGDFASLLPHSLVGGDSVIEADVLVGMHASVINRVRVGRGARVGAGAVVIRDVAAGTTVVGVPARQSTRTDTVCADSSAPVAPAQDLILLGGGGHASDTLSTIEYVNRIRPTWNVIGFADDSPDPRVDRFEARGVPFLGSIEHALAACRHAQFVVTVGFPEGRRAVAERALQAGLVPATVINPDAFVGTGTQIGEGSVLMATRTGALVRIGRFAYLSSGTIVGHDAQIGDYCSLMPGAIVSGEVVMGECAMVGINASVIEKRRIGARAKVGAGAVVARDVAPDTTVVGVPARPVPT